MLTHDLKCQLQVSLTSKLRIVNWFILCICILSLWPYG